MLMISGCIDDSECRCHQHCNSDHICETIQCVMPSSNATNGVILPVLEEQPLIGYVGVLKCNPGYVFARDSRGKSLVRSIDVGCFASAEQYNETRGFVWKRADTSEILAPCIEGHSKSVFVLAFRSINVSFQDALMTVIAKERRIIVTWRRTSANPSAVNVSLRTPMECSRAVMKRCIALKRRPCLARLDSSLTTATAPNNTF